LVEKKKPLRRCIACNNQKEKQELLRIIRNPQKELEIDLTGKKNGRGAYICKNEECLNLAKKTKRLERALEVNVKEEFYEEIRGVISGK
jgi:predicted RNA-binding protein YlxR (DUF448 family)